MNRISNIGEIIVHFFVLLFKIDYIFVANRSNLLGFDAVAVDCLLLGVRNDS